MRSGQAAARAVPDIASLYPGYWLAATTRRTGDVGSECLDAEVERVAVERGPISSAPRREPTGERLNARPAASAGMMEELVLLVGAGDVAGFFRLRFGHCLGACLRFLDA
jgi:hypothetical protein